MPALRLLLCLLLWASMSAAWGSTTLKIVGDNLQKEMRQNIEAYIGPREETDRMSFRMLSQHAEKKTQEALQALGYYHPKILIARKNEGDNTLCILTINPGEPILIDTIDIRFDTSSPHSELADFSAKNAPRSGDVFHHGRYDTFKSNLLQQALQHGYFSATWTTQQALVDIDKNRVNILLVLATGVRHHIGEITITGTDIDTDLMARFPRFHTGDWYDRGKIAELHRDLVRTGWFDGVHISAEPSDSRDETVPVDIEYTMRKRNRVGIGAGFSTDIGPRMQLQWEKPWLNSKGHSLSTYAEVAETRSQLGATWLMPLTDPVTSQLAYTYGLQFAERDDFKYWLTTAGIEHRKRLPSQWRVTRSLELGQATDDFGDRQTRTTLLMPGIALSRTESHGTPLVRHGWRTTGKIQFAADAVGSDTNMARATLDSKAIYSLGSRVRTIVRASGGALSTTDILEIPISLRFFSGGDQSIRGYDYQSIAPVDSNNILVGGRYKLEGGIEFDYRLANRWLIAIFADHGSSFNDFGTTDFFTGAGAGLRWVSPIGPLRLDFAWGASLEKPSFNVHFYMGPEL